MKKGFVTIGVKSIKESLDFYKEVMDFKLDSVVNPAPGVELNWLSNSEGMVIELVKIDHAPEPNNPETSLTLTFMVENLEEKENLLKDKKVQYKTVVLPNGLNVHRFKDPNGISLSFMDIMEH